MCHSYKTLYELKVKDEPKVNFDMQVLLAKVPLRKNLKKKYSHTLKDNFILNEDDEDNFILNEADKQSFGIMAECYCHIFEGEIQMVTK